MVLLARTVTLIIVVVPKVGFIDLVNSWVFKNKRHEELDKIWKKAKKVFGPKGKVVKAVGKFEGKLRGKISKLVE